MEYVDGNERRFGAEDLFFPTADIKGVIRRTNRAFNSLSRHSSEEPVGSPHNTTQHDGMPAGVLKFMWDELEQECSSHVYMLNRAKGGRDYWVFATTTPLADGYLSIRVRPTNHTMSIPVEEIYARVRATERAYTEGGHRHREVVEYGVALLTKELARLQYHDLHNFARVALPRELVLLVVEGMRVPSHAESDNPMSAVLQVIVVIRRDTDELTYQLGEYQKLINGLGSWAAGARSVIDRVDRVGSLMGEMTSPDVESSVPIVSERVKERRARAVEVLRQLNPSLVALYEATFEVCSRSSTVRLHALMAGIFAAAVLDGREGEFDDAIGDLVGAMFSDLEKPMPFYQEVANLAGCLEGDLRSVVNNLDCVRRSLQHWIHALQDEGVQALVEDIDVEAVLGETVIMGEQDFPETVSLAELAAKARGVVATSNGPATRQQVAAVRETLSHLGE